MRALAHPTSLRVLRSSSSDSLVKQPRHFDGQSSAALFLCGAGCAVVWGKIRIARTKNRGRAGRLGSKGTRGPRRLATSRLVEVLCASPFTLVRAIGKACRKSAKPKASRARCLIGLLRIVPGGRISVAFTRWGFTALTHR